MLSVVFRRSMSLKVLQRPLVAVIGPTGTGKSQLAVFLAERFGGEVINGDALQMYEGLPITTNQISSEERKGIPHHLLSCVPLASQPWTIHEFHERAVKIIGDIRERGRLPILVGGTHYYTQSLLFPKTLIEDVDESSVSKAEDEEKKWPILGASSEEMLEELRKVDPVMAERWHPNDRRKIRRSLQMYLQTGMRASHIYEEQRGIIHNPERDILHLGSEMGSRANDPIVFWTHSAQPDLFQRLDRRVDQMVSDGLLTEVRNMYDFAQKRKNSGSPVDESSGIWIAIGYRQMVPCILESNTSETDKLSCIEQTKLATRQYGKRQHRWIRTRTLPAMQEAGLSHRLFLLDATDISLFSSNVEQVAARITESFLSGEVLPDPTSLSNAAKENLVVVEKKSSSARYCAACDKTIMFDAEWTSHLGSKGHKRNTKPKIDWAALYPRNEEKP